MKIRELIPTIENLSNEQLKELVELGHDAAEEIEIRKDKTFVRGIKNYDTEVQESYDDGYKTGLEWPEKWNHRPGGPFVFSADYKDTVEWKQKARLSADKNKAWLRGWDDGKKKQDELKKG